ncbi:MAG TPA: CsgG/HfaB family protein, partial [bacterium]|nr:CsgG/HfaB family protein [bacterium]
TVAEVAARDIHGISGHLFYAADTENRMVRKMTLKESPEAVEKPVKITIPELEKGEKVNLAIIDFSGRPPLSQAEAAFISDFFRADLVKIESFSLIDKSNMDKILAEQGFQQSGCSSMECAVQIGKLLNVQYMMMGSCGKLLNKYIITLNLVSVQTAQIVYSDDASTDNADILREIVKNMVDDFLKAVK